jgi:HPt (histidine-containing phosphotransfer) domain-containing protein
MAGKNDKLALLRAYLGDDTRQVKEMLELFLENIPNDLKELTLLCEKNDIENARKAAHQMKSSVKFFGLNEVGEILQKMELLSKENPQKNQLKALVTQVNQLMEPELEHLRKELSRL